MGGKECLGCDGGLWLKRLSEGILGKRLVVLYCGLVLKRWRAGLGCVVFSAVVWIPLINSYIGVFFFRRIGQHGRDRPDSLPMILM